MARAATVFEKPLAVAAAAAMLMLAGCAASPPDRQQQTDQATQQIGSLPAVVSATNVVSDSVDEGLVYAEVHVRVADGATGDQVAAVASTYLDHLRTVDYSGYRTELDVALGGSTFVIGNGRRQVTNDPQIVQQAREWTALLARFPGSAVTLHAAVTHPPDPKPGAVPDQPAAGRVELPDASAYPDVAAAFPTLAATVPESSAGHWVVGAGKQHPAEITTTGRWPTDAELQVWRALNADQSIPHADGMTINGLTTGPLWIAETTAGHDPALARQLATQHLPLLAGLPAPVLYTATDSWSGHLDATGQATSPTVVTVGGCTRRTYKTTPDEQVLINAYETCKR
jgi:hypothetical protein